jgi:hypothetical protein
MTSLLCVFVVHSHSSQEGSADVMPLEIRELHIKVNLNEPSPTGGAGAQVPRPAEAGGGENKDMLIAQCVDEVMQVLRNRKER